MTPDAIKQLQINLKMSPTGVLDQATIDAMNKAIGTAVAANPDVAKYAGNNATDVILNAYMTGDWSGVLDLTGKPFTREQQQAAVAQAEKALAPAYKAQEAYDRSVVEDSLRDEQEGFDQFRKDEAKYFETEKNILDQNAADQGVLFAGSRVQKQNDLRTTYADREAQRRAQGAGRIQDTMRGYQYEYGNEGVRGLNDLYRLPGASTFNAGVAGGEVKPSGSISSVYNPKQFKFQGTKPVAQKAAVQTRAASLLGNRANKLSALGYGMKF